MRMNNLHIGLGTSQPLRVIARRYDEAIQKGNLLSGLLRFVRKCFAFDVVNDAKRRSAKRCWASQSRVPKSRILSQ